MYKPFAKQDITWNGEKGASKGLRVRDSTMPHSAQNLEKCKNSTCDLAFQVIIKVYLSRKKYAIEHILLRSLLA